MAAVVSPIAGSLQVKSGVLSERWTDDAQAVKSGMDVLMGDVIEVGESEGARKKALRLSWLDRQIWGAERKLRASAEERGCLELSKTGSKTKSSSLLYTYSYGSD